MLTILLMYLAASSLSYAADVCQCGWRVRATGEVFTHRILNDFGQYSDIDYILKDTRAAAFNQDWMVYDFWHNSDNSNIRLNAKYEAENVRIKDGYLQLTQRGYSETNRHDFAAMSVAGIQTRDVNILHGSFNVVMKVGSSSGGSCASFFWYHVRLLSITPTKSPDTNEIGPQNDKAEIDIEAVSQGTSLVNNTINYTIQPSTNSKSMPIKNATLSLPMLGQHQTAMTTLRQHRFDCSPTSGVTFYLDNDVMHQNTHVVQREGGSVQLKLWADGNRWWSSVPSNTDVVMSVRSISLYYNTTQTTRDEDQVRLDMCSKASGPSERTLCDVESELALISPAAVPQPTTKGNKTAPLGPLFPKVNRGNRVSAGLPFRLISGFGRRP